MKRTLQQTGLILAMMILATAAYAGTWTNFSNFTDVTQIAEQGNDIWVAAKGGLMRYDKATGTKTYFKKGAGQLPSLSVERVAFSTAGNSIWIGTYDNGIARFNGTTWEHHPFPMTDAMLYDMKIAANGDIWCSTSDGLYKYANNQFTRHWNGYVNAPWSIDIFSNGKILCASNQPYIFDPAIDSFKLITTNAFSYSNGTVLIQDDSTYYFAGDAGMVAKFRDTTQIDTFTVGSLLVNMQISPNGMLMGLSQQHVMIQRNGQYTDTIAFGNGNITAFHVSSDGGIWAGGVSEGITNDFGKLYHKDAQNQVTETNLRKNDLSDNWSHDLQLTTDKNILVVNNSSIQKFNVAANQFTNEWKPDSVNMSFSCAIEWRGKLYAGTSYRYLQEYTGGHWNELGQGSFLTSEVGHLAIDKDDNLWITGPGYIAKYDGTQFSVFTPANTPAIIPNIYMRAIHCDTTRNIVWVATYSGILKYANGTFTLLNDSNTVGIQQYYDAIESISEDDAHNIWFGTVYGGILKYDGNAFSTMLLPQHLGNQTVTSIQIMHDTLYVGDNLNGIWVYQNGQFDSMNTANSGLSDNNITSMVKDAAGNLWISHLSYGLDVYNKSGVTVSAIAEVAPLQANVYPNPSTGIFFLETNEAQADIQIFTVTGSQVLQLKSAVAKTVIDLSGQPRGLYFANVTTMHGTKTVKLILQ